eukprot:1815532-Pleurochrysis_carterae.AAC.4
MISRSLANPVPQPAFLSSHPVLSLEACACLRALVSATPVQAAPSPRRCSGGGASTHADGGLGIGAR